MCGISETAEAARGGAAESTGPSLIGRPGRDSHYRSANSPMNSGSELDQQHPRLLLMPRQNGTLAASSPCCIRRRARARAREKGRGREGGSERERERERGEETERRHRTYCCCTAALLQLLLCSLLLLLLLLPLLCCPAAAAPLQRRMLPAGARRRAAGAVQLLPASCWCCSCPAAAAALLLILLCWCQCFLLVPAAAEAAAAADTAGADRTAAALLVLLLCPCSRSCSCCSRDSDRAALEWCRAAAAACTRPVRIARAHGRTSVQRASASAMRQAEPPSRTACSKQGAQRTWGRLGNHASARGRSLVRVRAWGGASPSRPTRPYEPTIRRLGRSKKGTKTPAW